MKRISYWTLSTLSVAVLLFGFDASQRGSNDANTALPLQTVTPGTSSGTTSSGSGNGNKSGPNKSGNSSSSSSAGKTRTSTVTGSTVQTQWGPVQIRLTISGAAITKVGIVQYPNGNSRDVEIANYAFPVLIRETMSSQSAQIDMVSGATYTSTGYIQSLQSALDQAGL